ncbi:MAG TPA: hypothetical protein VHK01_21570 [Lacipirellulaceae bacterium]|nr:hypothetical protein [Lacipirellulaceae bacterium]
MLNARNFLMQCRVAIAAALLLCCAGRADAQYGYGGNNAPVASLPTAPNVYQQYGPIPPGGISSLQSSLARQNNYGGTSGTLPRGPLARLIHNPDPTPGAPPFALTDQSGVIQRYVEPVPGIDLESHIDNVVVVRHDIGRTLLASQLELPPRPLYPMLAENSGMLELIPLAEHGLNSEKSDIQRARFADDDDTTVQLLSDAEDLSDGESNGSPRRATQNESLNDEVGARVEYLETPGLELVPGPLDCDPSYGSPHLSGPSFPGLDVAPPCSECGNIHMPGECGPGFAGAVPGFAQNPPQLCRYYGSVELNLLRAHILEGPDGKLSEKYEPSPRVTIGFNETGKIDGRVRYWHYSQDTPILGGGRIDVEMDVLDIEATNLLGTDRFEVLMGGGMRLTGIDLTDSNNDGAGADLLGMTLFAEGRSFLCSVQDGRIAWVYGGRLSILGGDWGADVGNNFTGGPVQDDNLVVHELHAGVVYAVRRPDFDLHARLGFEMQNWHSDALSQNSGRDSIGFLGPGIQVGAGF